MNRIDISKIKVVPIWQHKYVEKAVLIATYRFTKERVYFFFCADEKFDNFYSVNTNDVINNCIVRSNGKIDCYEIPFELVRDEGAIPIELYKQLEIEKEKYNKWKEGKRNAKCNPN